MVKVEAYYMKEIKKQKQKTQIRVFGLEYVYAYIGPTYATHMYAYAYTPQNPNPKTQKCRKQSKT